MLIFYILKKFLLFLYNFKKLFKMLFLFKILIILIFLIKKNKKKIKFFITNKYLINLMRA